MHALADTIFGPVLNILQTIIGYLSNISVVLSDGINVGDYFGYIGLMGAAWVSLVKSFITCFVLVSTLKVGKMGFNMYLQLKDGVKWW